jgi:arylsulfatase A-like enzyme
MPEDTPLFAEPSSCKPFHKNDMILANELKQANIQIGLISMFKKPNVVYVFSDQHRAQAAAYAGDPNAITPRLDQLAAESIRFTTAVACIPVCSPNRACMMTGQYPLTHGLFVNDIPIGSRHISIGEAYAAAGYDTAYIGKWHIDGYGRESFIPRERRKGFEHWQVLECTHNYNNSAYFGDTNELQHWKGYDAEAQTRSACEYIQAHSSSDKPFFLVLSWGPPHDPYQTAPQRFQDLYDKQCLQLRPNVPEEAQDKARAHLSGYYAHVSALDECIGQLLDTLREQGLEDDTIFVYTSDHGDMLESHGLQNKQYPYDESILVPLLVRYPMDFGREGRIVDIPINTPDLMPTLLGLCCIDIPDTVEGTNYADFLRGTSTLQVEGALIEIIHPFGQWPRAKGGKEYRGIRTPQYTYIMDLQGPWLLFDNKEDPYQLDNLCGRATYSELQDHLEHQLQHLLNMRDDPFLSGEANAEIWGYVLDPITGKVTERREKGTAPS